MKKILFYPGTFNPPHYGHISTVLVALKSAHFDEVWIMPSGKRVDKEIATSYEDRKNLGNILVEYLRTKTDTPIKLISTAVDGPDAKYTHEVIGELKSQSEDEIFQLVGIDGYLGIKERVISPEEKFVINKRPGYDFDEDTIPKHYLMISADEKVGSISSTQIRDMVKNKDEGYKKLVPETVTEYVEEKGLYL